MPADRKKRTSSRRRPARQAVGNRGGTPSATGGFPKSSVKARNRPASAVLISNVPTRRLASPLRKIAHEARPGGRMPSAHAMKPKRLGDTLKRLDAMLMTPGTSQKRFAPRPNASARYTNRCGGTPRTRGASKSRSQPRCGGRSTTCYVPKSSLTVSTVTADVRTSSVLTVTVIRPESRRAGGRVSLFRTQAVSRHGTGRWTSTA